MECRHVAFCESRQRASVPSASAVFRCALFHKITCSPCFIRGSFFRNASMHDASYTFLKNLLLTPSPSGFERQIQEIVRAWGKPLAHEVRTDRHGNVLAVVNLKGSPRIMLAGH